MCVKVGRYGFVLALGAFLIVVLGLSGVGVALAQATDTPTPVPTVTPVATFYPVSTPDASVTYEVTVPILWRDEMWIVIVAFAIFVIYGIVRILLGLIPSS